MVSRPTELPQTNEKEKHYDNHPHRQRPAHRRTWANASVALDLLRVDSHSCCAILVDWSGNCAIAPARFGDESAYQLADGRLPDKRGDHPCVPRRETCWRKEALEERFRSEANYPRNLVRAYHFLDTTNHLALVWDHALYRDTAPRPAYSMADDSNPFCPVLYRCRR